MKKFLFTLLAAIVLLPSCDKEDEYNKDDFTGGKNNPLPVTIYIENVKDIKYRSTEIYDSVWDNLGQPYDSIPTITGNRWIQMKPNRYNGLDRLEVIANYKQDYKGEWINVRTPNARIKYLEIDNQREEVEKFDWHDTISDKYFIIGVVVVNIVQTYIIDGAFRDSEGYTVLNKTFIEIVDEIPVDTVFRNSIERWGGHSSADFSEFLDKYSKLYFITE